VPGAKYLWLAITSHPSKWLAPGEKSNVNPSVVPGRVELRKNMCNINLLRKSGVQVGLG
jgi:hypothetical protein